MRLLGSTRRGLWEPLKVNVLSVVTASLMPKGSHAQALLRLLCSASTLQGSWSFCAISPEHSLSSAGPCANPWGMIPVISTANPIAL